MTLSWALVENRKRSETVTARVPREVKEAVLRLARDDGRTASEIVLRALVEGLALLGA